tara:strand:- start:216 stop:515 length:300 start_codon:yes stop_codon:yes gene_type:complete
MRKLMAEGKLSGPPAELMSPTVPEEQLFDTEKDPHEIKNLATSSNPEHRKALIAMRTALDTWIVETQDRGEFPEPEEIVAPFDKEMHDWFGTPNWYKKK